MPEARIFHNPRCSKSRGCLQILQERGVETRVVRYLDEVVDREQLLWLYKQLGAEMIRTQEPVWKELALLPGASPNQIIEALLKHPILIERPIVILGERAIVGRPPEKVLELLMERQ